MTEFRHIHINEWRQFREVDIDFSAQTTVLTGSNGSGKTSILNILSHHFGWNWLFVSTPYLSRKAKKKIYSDWRMSTWDPESQPTAPAVGWIDYSTGARCTLRAPPNIGQQPQYHLQYDNQSPVPGLHIPSHRPPISYHPVAQIPTDPKDRAQLYQEFQNILFQSFSATRTQNPGLVIKQSLISLAVFGFGNDAVAPNHEYREIFETFQAVLQILLPPELGFQRIEIRMPDVVMVCVTGEFSLDAMSGGVSAIVALAWQIHMFGFRGGECTVLIDEPENHLHPTMQRTLVPNLGEAFPNHKFVLATHSPFIVASDERATVYGLKYGDDRKVRSVRLDSTELSSSPERVLKEILDVPTVLPVWVESKMRSILAQHSSGSIDDARAIYEQIRDLGLSDILPSLPRIESGAGE